MHTNFVEDSNNARMINADVDDELFKHDAAIANAQDRTDVTSVVKLLSLLL